MTIWRFLVILCFVVSLGLALVYMHASQLGTAHQIAGALRTRDGLLKEKVQLEAEISELSTADWIASKVEEFDLGLVTANKGSSLGAEARPLPARILTEMSRLD